MPVHSLIEHVYQTTEECLETLAEDDDYVVFNVAETHFEQTDDEGDTFYEQGIEVTVKVAAPELGEGRMVHSCITISTDTLAHSETSFTSVVASVWEKLMFYRLYAIERLDASLEAVAKAESSPRKPMSE